MMFPPLQFKPTSKLVIERDGANHVHIVLRGQTNHELRCIAAPVRNFTRQTIAALGISGPVWRVTLKDMQRLSARVASIAADLSRDLGFKEPDGKHNALHAVRKRG